MKNIVQELLGAPELPMHGSAFIAGTHFSS